MEDKGKTVRELWLAKEQAMRANLAGPGVASRDDLKSHSGMEFLQAIGAGKFPQAPIAVLLDFVPIEVEPGRIVFQGTPKPEHYNPIGSVHGGYIATLLDSAVGCAIHDRVAAIVAPAPCARRSRPGSTAAPPASAARSASSSTSRTASRTCPPARAPSRSRCLASEWG